MAKAKFYTEDGKEKGTRDLPANLFDCEVNEPVIHQAVVTYLANRRQGDASTKERSDVRGGGIKPFRQKGTGRARAGTLGVPNRYGGGVAFGPKPRHHTVKVNRKARRKAMRAALSVHAERGSVAVLDPAAFETPSTKAAVAALEKWGARRPTLVVIEAEDIGALKSFRNIERVQVAELGAVGVADLIGAASLVVSEGALAKLTERLGGDR
jgi:large subunit ribosomal protein L4